MKYPFETSLPEILIDIDAFVSLIFSSLQSEFLTLPKGEGFVEYPVFEGGYEALKRATSGFHDVTPPAVLRAAKDAPISIIVLRTILGFTPPEWAYLATQATGLEIGQGFVRNMDRAIRVNPEKPLSRAILATERTKALIETACELLATGAPHVEANKIHRLDKADTKNGLVGVRSMAQMGVPYAMLLYERLLGRPFAAHRDSVSDLVGDSLESAVEAVLVEASISYRKTKRAERLAGFDQAPDFIVPSEFNPQVVIEAKMTEDDGTARDKVTRVQHLAELAREREAKGDQAFEVIACIGGRGFGVRREDMKKLLITTRGKVFTADTLGRLVDCSRLKDFRST